MAFIFPSGTHIIILTSSSLCSVPFSSYYILLYYLTFTNIERQDIKKVSGCSKSRHAFILTATPPTKSKLEDYCSYAATANRGIMLATFPWPHSFSAAVHFLLLPVFHLVDPRFLGT